MSFRITGLSADPFRHLYGLSDEQLAQHRAKRYVADAKPGFPDRIEMRELEPGETALLVHHEHQPGDSPYRASHAVFVREGAEASFTAVDTIPEVMRIRMLSLRAFDEAHMMVDGDLVDGREVEAVIGRMLADPQVAYVHVYYAKRGCYSARIDRV